MGLITAYTNLDYLEVITKIKRLLELDPNFFQYILKIVPINYVCETNVDVISSLVESVCSDYIKENSTYKIVLKRRDNDIIDRQKFIGKIAKIIDAKVNLDNPDVIVRIEILGNLCGLSFHKPEELIKIRSKWKKSKQ